MLEPTVVAQLAPGVEVRASRGLYWHHGVYIGRGLVAHLAGDQRKDKMTASVRISALMDFADGGRVEVVTGRREDGPAAEAIRRALSRLGEKGYDLVNNNCEHFARWCRSGKPTSPQIACAAFLLIAGGIMVWAVASDR